MPANGSSRGLNETGKFSNHLILGDFPLSDGATIMTTSSLFHALTAAAEAAVTLT